MQNVLPLLSSLTLHAVLILVGAATAGAVVSQMRKVEQPQVGAATSGIPSNRIGDDVVRLLQTGTPVPKGLLAGTSDPDAFVTEDLKAGTVNANLRTHGGGGDGEAPAVHIGLGQGGLGAGGGTGTGDGKGNGPGKENGDGGQQARFGLPDGTGFGPGGPVFVGNRGARRIVFVCDATGTMINRFALLRMELARTVARLQPVQSYNVVFFHDQGFAAASKESLLLATADNKRRTQAFLDDFTPSGQTNPLPALKLAFAQQPDLVYFLTDGEFNNLVSYQQVVDEVRRLNAGGKAKVNTISFGSYDKEAGEALEKIASENGGFYKRVEAEDLSGG